MILQRIALSGGQILEVTDDVGDGHHVGQIDVDIEQKDFVHQFAPFSHGFARHDHPKTVGRIAAGGIDTVAGADAGHNQRVDRAADRASDEQPRCCRDHAPQLRTPRLRARSNAWIA